MIVTELKSSKAPFKRPDSWLDPDPTSDRPALKYKEPYGGFQTSRQAVDQQGFASHRPFHQGTR